MKRLIISTVGTSLLTNQIDREFEESWNVRLRDTANYSSEEVAKYHEDVSDIIQTVLMSYLNGLKIQFRVIKMMVIRFALT